MKTTLLLSFTLAFLVAACASDHQTARSGASQLSESPTPTNVDVLGDLTVTSGGSAAPDEQPLYLHLLAPRIYGQHQIPARKIVTARVHLSRTFAAIRKGGVEPALSGRIEQEDGKFIAHGLSGRNGSTKNVFWGEMELEKPVWSKGGLAGSIACQAVFVLSTNSDCSEFLTMIDPDGQRPNTRATD